MNTDCADIIVNEITKLSFRRKQESSLLLLFLDSHLRGNDIVEQNVNLFKTFTINITS